MYLPFMTSTELLGGVTVLYPTIPIIVMTAHPRGELIQIAINRGAAVQLDYPYVERNTVKALQGASVLPR
jgi:FixJ family two-component response regulator